MKNLIVLMSLFVSVAVAASEWDDAGLRAFITCADKANPEEQAVKLYAWSEGVAGMSVQDKSYLIDERLKKQAPFPLVEMKEFEKKGEIEVVEFSYMQEWKVNLNLFDLEPFETILYLKKVQIPLVCKFTGST